MNISNWTDSQLMQLPDYLFGRRWPIAVGGDSWYDDEQIVLSNAALPDRCVIWQAWAVHMENGAQDRWSEFRLSDFLPTTEAEFNVLDPIFPYLTVWGGFISAVAGQYEGAYTLSELRQIIRPQGRRLCVRFATTHDTPKKTQAGMIISSIPTEIPEWFSSGPG